jgi:hypothetical protein
MFYRRVEDEFQDKCIELKKSVEKLELLPPEFISEEKKLALPEELKAVKPMLENLDALKKLLDAKAINPNEYEELKKKILGKASS